MPIKYQQIVKILRRFGYVIKHQRWSHQKWINWSNSIIVPYHKELVKKTALSILKDLWNQQWIDYKELIKTFNLKL